MLTRRRLLKSGVSALALLAPAGFPVPVTAATARKGVAVSRAGDSQQAANGLAHLIRQARSWTYQLQNYDLAQLQASLADVLVVDETIGTDARGRRSRKAVQNLQTKPDGGRRIVLAYLSIGEAEDYRYYWKPEWIETAEPDAPETAPASPGAEVAKPAEKPSAPTRPNRWPSKKAPPWLGDENESWSGNFAVRYEHPDWQAIFLDGEKSYIARIIAAGFDGVYLDRVDAFYDHQGDLAEPASAMVAFVARIAETARRIKPGFLIVPQNGEELLLRPAYVDIIDAIAKEDLLYGSPTEGKPNSNGQIGNSVGWLANARRKDRPVLVVEYLDDPNEIVRARDELKRLGYVATFAPRMLDAVSPYALPPLEHPSGPKP